MRTRLVARDPRLPYPLTYPIARDPDFALPRRRALIRTLPLQGRRVVSV